MIEKRENEWQALAERAGQMLEKPELWPQAERVKHFKPVLHLWIAPTFTPEKHWIFYEPRPLVNPLPKPLIRQMSWQKETDFRRLNDPLNGLKEGFHTDPTFEIKTADIDREEFEKFHRQLAKIQLPAFVRDEMLGLDGETFGVETLGLYHRAKISWWSVYPEEWKPLAFWFDKARHFLEEKFK